MSARLPNAIPGNEGFTQIQSFTKQINRLNVNDTVSKSLSVDEFNLAGPFSDTDASPGRVLHRVVGYTPKQFKGLGHSGKLFFNNKPNVAAATLATSPDLLTLPVGALIVKARMVRYLTDITVSGGDTHNIQVAIQPFSLGSGGAGANLFNQAPLTSATPQQSSVNNIEGLTVYANVLNTATVTQAFGKSGTALPYSVSGNDGKVGETKRHLGFEVGFSNANGTAITPAPQITEGAVAIVIEYLL